MRVTHIDELARIADGEKVEVEGRYERWNPNLGPPGEIPVSARVIPAGGGGGLLIGGYLDPESRRPDGELARLSGAIVRVVGTYLATRAFPGPGPMPGLWTGGGPQLVNVASIELIEAAAPRVTAADEPVADEPAPAPTAPPPAPPSLGVRSTVPSRIGSLARRSLAGGVSRMIFPFSFIALLGVAAALFFALRAAGNPLDRRIAGGAPFLGGCLAFFAVDQLLIRLLAARELRRLTTLPFAFDLAAYAAALDGEPTSGVLFIEVELASPAAESLRASLVAPRLLGSAAVSFSHPCALSIRCPPVVTSSSSMLASRVYRDNARLHRWFRRCESVLARLHATTGVRAIAAHLE